MKAITRLIFWSLMTVLVMACGKIEETPAAVAFAIWPQDVTLKPGESVQFYAAVRFDDGTVECVLGGAGCDSAIALLPPVFVDTLGL